MNFDAYQRERGRLLEVLKDAVDRGDYFLEFDTQELIDQLNEKYYSKDDQNECS